MNSNNAIISFSHQSKNVLGFGLFYVQQLNYMWKFQFNIHILKAYILFYSILKYKDDATE